MTIYKDDLERVYALIEKEENWTQHTSARNEDGTPCPVDSDNAVRWCVVGAFCHFDLADGWEIPTRLLMPEADIECMRNHGGGVAIFNDTHTHAEVLALLRSAIERAPVRVFA